MWMRKDPPVDRAYLPPPICSISPAPSS
ncbi:MAG: hypothetical protein R3F43_16935 [bacterium]